MIPAAVIIAAPVLGVVALWLAGVVLRAWRMWRAAME